MTDFRKLNVSCRFHVATSIEGLLALKDRDIQAMLPFFSGLDGEPAPSSVEEVREELQKELAEGHRLIRAHGCDNFDPVEGCLGHPLDGKEFNEYGG